ncbi:MAG TPA: hypothetical protein VFQ07_01315 [Candidatus Polarisedimenticolia bacterium]|nr:hypothetical protein [Candidatus Polarisedimenticolia bacterium]
MSRRASRSPVVLCACLIVLATVVRSDGRSAEKPPVPSRAPAPAAQPPDCSGPEYRQFDFWAGDWEVKDAADGSTTGTNSVTRILGGCVLQEHWRGVKGLEGTSFNLYDRADAAWHQTWVDSRGGRLDIAGGLRDGRMVLEGKDRKGLRGELVRDRITWSPLPDGRVRQHWEQSHDQGVTWATAFDGMYSRKPGS